MWRLPLLAFNHFFLLSIYLYIFICLRCTKVSSSSSSSWCIFYAFSSYHQNATFHIRLFFVQNKIAFTHFMCTHCWYGCAHRTTNADWILFENSIFFCLKKNERNHHGKHKNDNFFLSYRRRLIAVKSKT